MRGPQLITVLLFLSVTTAAEPPELYRQIAARYGVSDESLFRFALGQSSRKSHSLEVPWPWTVRIDGRRYQFPSRIEMFNFLVKNRSNASLRFGFDNRALSFQSREALWAELEPEAMLERSAQIISAPVTSSTSSHNLSLPSKTSPHPVLLPSSAASSEIMIASNTTDIIERVAAEVGIDPNLLHAVIDQESAFNTRAKSHKGAMGLMQLMPATAQHLGLSEAQYYDPYHNVHAGARYLKQQLQDFGSLPLALAAYNAGPSAVHKYGGIPPYQETRQYVASITYKYSLLGGVIK